MDRLDPDLLRTFVAFVDSGTLARAAAAVGRSPSAVTAQMRRLEEQVGEPLMVAAGRGRALTPVGEELAGHARRILEAHRQAVLSLRGARADGQVSVAATQDFAERGLPAQLRRFAATHPRLRIALRIGRSVPLAADFAAGEIDVLLAMRGEPAADEIGLIHEPMVWLAAAGGLAVAPAPLPLALLDPPCGFRTAALAALNRAGRDYRIAATSPSLAGLKAAVLAGLAVTLRTARFAGPDLTTTTATLALPDAGEAVFAVRLRAGASAAAADLARLLHETRAA
ncbi:HTH-type transcriptional regulator CysB [Rhodoplanes serenus]|uniref:HTH-type transcriptional regulator CysB n=1 Tax=Rhodoplanes serenus TaxID=200615 RepID=A0A3S4BFT4_9BRAD|nr:LysR substrate-binding domain-containing protein [Rhodoplanes serenus]VCU08867.1 HTH-type transcriptional regulator CysB [Rhodoplanes serenus]